MKGPCNAVRRALVQSAGPDSTTKAGRGFPARVQRDSGCPSTWHSERPDRTGQATCQMGRLAGVESTAVRSFPIFPTFHLEKAISSCLGGLLSQIHAVELHLATTDVGWPNYRWLSTYAMNGD